LRHRIMKHILCSCKRLAQDQSASVSRISCGRQCLQALVTTLTGGMQRSVTSTVDHEHAAMNFSAVLLRFMHLSISVYMFGRRADLPQAVLVMVPRWKHGRRTSQFRGTAVSVEPHVPSQFMWLASRMLAHTCIGNYR
jgi:hypothetical protein